MGEDVQDSKAMIIGESFSDLSEGAVEAGWEVFEGHLGVRGMVGTDLLVK